jgi:tetratricopeptide (TPR) repeat protein
MTSRWCPLIARPGLLNSALVSAIVAITCVVTAQTYDVSSGASKIQQGNTEHGESPAQPLGWGSNIQNARLARAAQQALQHGDHALALDYAQRAAQATPNDPQLWFLLGYAARLDGKLPASVDAYTRGLRLNPSALDGLSGLAQTYSFMGRSEDAERLLKQVLSSDPRRGEDALLLGDLYMRSADYSSALDWLGKAERLQPGARPELLMALSYQHMKQMDMADHYLELARRRDPDNPDVQRAMAGYYRAVGSYPEAIAALRLIPNPRPDVTAELAYTYQLDGKMEDSARLYARAANSIPKDLGLQFAAAQAEVAVGSIIKANSFLDRAAALDANHYRLHAIRGEIAQLQEREEDGVLEYSAALASLPANPSEGPLYRIQLHMDLMELYRNMTNDGAAHRELEIAQSEINGLAGHGSDRGPLLRLRARIKMNAGDLDGALADIREDLAIDADERNDLQLNGDILTKLGRTEDAISAYKRILTNDPTNRSALISLGYASLALGLDKNAEKYFLRLAEADPSLYVPYLALGDLYAARHEFTKAQVAYSKGYALAPRKALILAGGMNAAIEAHNLSLAGTWLGRVTSAMQQNPQILRETERYLSFMGQYQESAQVGRKAIKALPQDRDVVVYLWGCPLG